MRSVSWIVLIGLLAVSFGCQRAEKNAAHQASNAAATSPATDASEKTPPADEPGSDDTETPDAAAPAKQEMLDARTASTEDAAEQEPTRPQLVAQSKQPSPEAAPQPTAQARGVEKGAPSKAEILASPEFRRVIFEFNEWLTAQPIYTPQQVADIKNQFNHRVAEMNAQELLALLNDMEAKMQVINTPEAREARAWMAQYLSVMSDRKRSEVLKEVPNVATMTAGQLSSELSRIQERRAQLDSQQAAFQKGQAVQVAQQVQTDRIGQQNFVRDWNSGPTAYSPYTGNSNANQRLNNAPIGTGMTFYTGSWGGVGVAFSPSSW